MASAVDDTVPAEGNATTASVRANFTTIASEITALQAALPSGDVVGTTDSQTLAGKSIDLASNTLTGTTAQFNAALSDGSFATLAGTETLTNKTLTSPDINGGTIDGTVIGGTTAAAGTFTTFTSTGIDDNASATALTIDSSGNVSIGADTDVFADIGRARVGFITGLSDYAVFAHVDQASVASYALIQDFNGNTFVNAPGTSVLRFRKQNVDVAYFDTDGFLNVGTHTALGSETLSGYITIKDIAGNSRKIGVIS